MFSSLPSKRSNRVKASAWPRRSPPGCAPCKVCGPCGHCPSSRCCPGRPARRRRRPRPAAPDRKDGGAVKGLHGGSCRARSENRTLGTRIVCKGRRRRRVGMRMPQPPLAGGFGAAFLGGPQSGVAGDRGRGLAALADVLAVAAAGPWPGRGLFSPPPRPWPLAACAALAGPLRLLGLPWKRDSSPLMLRGRNSSRR